ncbi:hypothetical protein EVAR_37359_1 [Eumeta japonica]|uniref:Uncharacterized protein n=1 Tax=Eumeta variegata TaxID=151549 RepID=A0A4C1X1Q8_EUMVA|nr:hypothetical protein EVAR_37359_1 [Eumeta japonica]
MTHVRRRPNKGFPNHPKRVNCDWLTREIVVHITTFFKSTKCLQLNSATMITAYRDTYKEYRRVVSTERGRLKPIRRRECTAVPVRDNVVGEDVSALCRAAAGARGRPSARRPRHAICFCHTVYSIVKSKARAGVVSDQHKVGEPRPLDLVLLAKRNGDLSEADIFGINLLI